MPVGELTGKEDISIKEAILKKEENDANQDKMDIDNPNWFLSLFTL